MPDYKPMEWTDIFGPLVRFSDSSPIDVHSDANPPADTFQAPKTYQVSPAALQKLRRLAAPWTE